jgi:hypothetical protein
MTDIIVVGLLLIIIFLILAATSPEILIYGMFGICIIGLVIMIIVGLIMFAQDPLGFIWSLIIHNPLSEFTKTVVDATPMIQSDGSIIHINH